jgi:hypothetical protein
MATTYTNLPNNSVIKDSATPTKTFFNSYYQQGIALSANDVDATIGFFSSRGFEKSAADTIAATLLSQAKIEGVSVQQLLDTLKGLNKLQLSKVVTEILNYNRLKISTLGYRVDNSNINQYELRNILI